MNPFRHLALIAVLALSACGDQTPSSAPASPAPPTVTDTGNPANWTIGPIYQGKSLSIGIPLHPTAGADGWFFDLPVSAAFPPAAHVHYVTAPLSLVGKTQIRMRYRIDMAEGVHIKARSVEGAPSMITLYFQRRGDDWSAKGELETFRWYYKPSMIMPLTAGVFEMVAPLDGDWTAVLSSSRASAPQAFADAVADAGEVGFVLGGGDGLGHGVYADGPARLTVLSFEVL